MGMRMPLFFAAGCSFTYGDELDDPETQAWPALVGRQFNAQVINKGLSGASNTHILNQIFEGVMLSPDLLMVGWTTPFRIEFCDETMTREPFTVSVANSDGTGWKTDSNDPSHRDRLLKYLNAPNNRVDLSYFQREFWRKVIYAQSFLKAMNVPYIFAKSFYLREDFSMYGRPRFIDDLLDTTRFLGWNGLETMTDWCYCSEKGKKGHPLVKGHEEIAQKFIEEIQNNEDIRSW